MPGKPSRWRRSGKPWRGETAAWLQRRRKAQPIAVLHQSSDGLSSHVLSSHLSRMSIVRIL